MECPAHNPETQAALDAWDALGKRVEGYRAINDRGSDGIEVSLLWKVDSEPPQFAVSVEDFKLHASYDLIPATLENYKKIYDHPMNALASIATKAAYEKSKTDQNFGLAGRDGKSEG